MFGNRNVFHGHRLFFFSFLKFIGLSFHLCMEGKYICTGSDDASLRIWNPKTGEIKHVIRGKKFS